MTLSKTLIASAAFAAMLVPAFAAAVTIGAMTPTLGGDRVIKRVVVKFDDINPADATGAATLYDRINNAATFLCTSNPGGHNLLISDKVERCRAQAVKQAVKDVGSAELVAITEAK